MKKRNGPEDPFGDESTDDGDDDRDDQEQTSGEDSESSDLPWIYERDSVKGERPHLIQANVRKETVDMQDEAQNVVEDILGEDVYATDLREAALLVAFGQPELLADKLREWGYDH